MLFSIDISPLWGGKSGPQTLLKYAEIPKQKHHNLLVAN